MAANTYTADRRLYLDRDGNVVEADDPNRATLLIGEGGALLLDDAVRYGLANPDGTAIQRQPAAEQPEGEKAQAVPPANKARARAPENK